MCGTFGLKTPTWSAHCASPSVAFLTRLPITSTDSVSWHGDLDNPVEAAALHRVAAVAHRVDRRFTVARGVEDVAELVFHQPRRVLRVEAPCYTRIVHVSLKRPVRDIYHSEWKNYFWRLKIHVVVEELEFRLKPEFASFSIGSAKLLSQSLTAAQPVRLDHSMSLSALRSCASCAEQTDANLWCANCHACYSNVTWGKRGVGKKPTPPSSEGTQIGTGRR